MLTPNVQRRVAGMQGSAEARSARIAARSNSQALTSRRQGRRRRLQSQDGGGASNGAGLVRRFRRQVSSAEALSIHGRAVQDANLSITSAAKKRMQAESLTRQAQKEEDEADKLKRAELLKIWPENETEVTHILQQEKSFNQAANALIRRVADARKAGVEGSDIVNELKDEIQSVFDLIVPSVEESRILYDVFNALQGNRYGEVEDQECLGGLSVFDLTKPVETTALDMTDGKYVDFSPASSDIWTKFKESLIGKFASGAQYYGKACQFLEIVNRQNQFRKKLSTLNEAAFKRTEEQEQYIQSNTVSAATVGHIIKQIIRTSPASYITFGAASKYVLIGTVYVRCKLTVDVEKGNVQIDLQETPGKENTFCVQMHALNERAMYLDSLYHNVDDPELYIGKRFSAKDLFKFVKSMGFETLELDDASSLDFYARERSRVVYLEKRPPNIGVYATFPDWVKAGPDGDDTKATEADGQENVISEDKKNVNLLSLNMTLFNLFKCIVRNRRGSLRLYGSATEAGTAAETSTDIADSDDESQVALFGLRKNTTTVSTPEPVRTEPVIPDPQLISRTCLKF